MIQNKFTALCATSLIGMTGTSYAEKAPRPNIITILVDDMGYSDLGCFGGEIETPNIDKLAKGGVRFTQLYSTPRCCPSRASLLTGLYPHQTGVGFMVYKDYGKPGYRKNINDECVTFGEVLQKAGYQTMMSGKWHVGHTDPKARPEVRGFDKFTGIYSHVDSFWKVLRGCGIFRDGKPLIPGGTNNPVNPYNKEKEFYTTDFFTDAAMDYIDQASAKKSKPFLLHLCYNVPHFPLETPDKLIEKYRGKYMKGWDVLRKEKFERMKKMGVISPNQKLPEVKAFNKQKIPGFINDAGLEANVLPKWDTISENDKKELDFRRAMYAGQIDSLDTNIGRLIAKLKEKGVYENTIIMFMSDNGCSGELGLYGLNWGKYKSTNYKNWRKKSGWSISQGQCWAAYSNTPFKKFKKFTHEGGISSPFFAHWPAGLKNHGAIGTKQYFHFIDIMPTLCELAGAKYPAKSKGKEIKPMEGISLLPYLKDPNKKTPIRPIYWQHENHAAVRYGKWKLLNINDRDDSKWQLFDMNNDRAEEFDVAEKYPEITKDLKEKWEKWAITADVKPFPETKKNK